MATSWRVPAVGLVVLALVGFAEPASAAAPDPVSGLVSSIVATADPELMEVLVTRTDAHGKPSFETIETPTKSKASEVVGKLLGAPGVVSVEMNQVVTVAKARHRKKCTRKKLRRGKCHASAGAAASLGD